MSGVPEARESAQGPGVPLTFAAMLILAWGLRLLLLPWEARLTPMTGALVHQGLNAAVLGGLPILWWVKVDPVGWRRILWPLPRNGRRARTLAILLAIAYVLALRLTAAVDGGPLVAIPPGAALSAVALVALGAAARATVEELLFRGYLLGRLCRGGLPFAVANAVQAAAFTALHVPGWLLGSGYAPAQVLGLLATTAVFGLIAATLVRLHGGLVIAIVTHAAVNIASGAGWAGAWSGLTGLY